MQAYFDAVEIVYHKGLRNFLFFNVPPEERSPAHVNDVKLGPKLKKNIILFNEVLTNFTDRFATTHPSANVVTFDAHSWFNKVLDNPVEFGFKNVTG